MIKPEGVGKLSGWTEAELDALSGIGPAKAGTIYEALQQLKQSEDLLTGENIDTQSPPGDSLYLPE